MGARSKAPADVALPKKAEDEVEPVHLLLKGDCSYIRNLQKVLMLLMSGLLSGSFSSICESIYLSSLDTGRSVSSNWTLTLAIVSMMSSSVVQ